MMTFVWIVVGLVVFICVLRGFGIAFSAIYKGARYVARGSADHDKPTD